MSLGKVSSLGKALVNTIPPRKSIDDLTPKPA
jgi:hypothetical protein